MASEHDVELADRIRAGTATGVLEADDPDAVRSRLPGAVHVALGDLPAAVALAGVRLAEVVVARARRAERELAADLAGRGTPPPDRPAVVDGDGSQADRQADRQAMRFASVILVLALPGGIAVHLADDMVLAPALPAAGLVLLGAVVLAHRRPGPPPAPAPEPDRPEDVDSTPAVRAAQGHLRRQQAAWKLSWWVRDQPVPDPDAWAPGLGAATPITLVAGDPHRATDRRAHATMTATAPAAVRVVVLQPRTDGPGSGA